MAMEALSELASNQLNGESQQEVQAEKIMNGGMAAGKASAPDVSEEVVSIEQEEAAGGPPMPAAGVEAAATKAALPVREGETDAPATTAGEALTAGAGGVGDAAMAAIDDRLDTGDLPHTNGHSEDAPQVPGDGAGVAVDYGRVANLIGNEGEQVPTMSFDIDQPAMEAPQSTGDEVAGAADEPAPGPMHAEEPAAAEIASTDSQLHANDASPIPATSAVPDDTHQARASSESQHVDPQLSAEPASSFVEQRAAETAQPTPSPLPQAEAAASASLEQSDRVGFSSLADLVDSQPAPPVSMDALPSDPTPLPSQLVSGSVDRTDAPMNTSENASSGFDAATAPTDPSIAQPEPSSAVSPPLVSPSLNKRPLEPETSQASFADDGSDLIEPELKRQKVSPEPVAEEAFKSESANDSMSIDAVQTTESANIADAQSASPTVAESAAPGTLLPTSTEETKPEALTATPTPEGTASISQVPNSIPIAPAASTSTAAAATPSTSKPPSMPKEQTKYAQAIVRNLKKKSEAAPFLQPVDPVALGIPHYPQVIAHPMDLGTVERKLQSGQYSVVEDFFNDVRLIWDNCVKFNGPENPISSSAKSLSGVFEKQALKMPTLETIANNAAIAAAKRSASPADKKQQAAPKKVRRASTNAGQKIAGASRAYEGEFNDYIQPPPPPSANPMRASTGASAAQPKKKGKTASMSGSLPPSGSPGIGPGGMMAGMPMGGPLSGQMGGSMHMQQLQQQQMQLLQQMQAMQNGGGAMGMGMNGPPSGGDVNALQLKFCKEVLKELFKKQHESFAYPFYDPVDYVALGIPDYPKVIRRPMDLGTMKRKLDNGQYSTAAAFENDFKLLINNCFTYNPPMTPVHKMGEQLQQVFYAKWRELPTKAEAQQSQWGGAGYGGDDFGHGYNSQEAMQIQLMQRQLELLTGNLEMMKAKNRMMGGPQPYGGPSMGYPPQMSPMQMQMQMPMQMDMSPPAPPAPAAAPVQKPPRPPPAARQPKAPAPAKRKSDPSYTPTASTSAPKARTTKRSSIARGDEGLPAASRSGKGGADDEDLDGNVTFDMKRELAEKIQEFDGPKLDKVVDIIRSSAPELLGDENKEIELDIDMLDQRTLLKLYEYVVHPVGKGRQLKPKKNKPKGRNRGVDEVAEEERINALQAQLDAMEGGTAAPMGMVPQGNAGGDASAATPQGGRGDVASSSSEDEDEDGSDSESEGGFPQEE